MPTETELSASGERRPVDDKRDVDETLPRRNVGEICHPKGVRAGCSEIATDQVQWSRRRLIRERRLELLSRPVPKLGPFEIGHKSAT